PGGTAPRSRQPGGRGRRREGEWLGRGRRAGGQRCGRSGHGVAGRGPVGPVRLPAARLAVRGSSVRLSLRQMLIEAPARPAGTLARLHADLGAGYLATGLIGFIFAATGPVAVILSVGTRGGLSQAELASWLFGAFFFNGLLTLAACWLYRQPLAFFW